MYTRIYSRAPRGLDSSWGGCAPPQTPLTALIEPFLRPWAEALTKVLPTAVVCDCFLTQPFRSKAKKKYKNNGPGQHEKYNILHSLTIQKTTLKFCPKRATNIKELS